MHDIQRGILKNLTLKRSLPYGKMKPSGVEGNRFTYHLHVLLNEGLIRKRGTLYTLSAKGKHLSDRMSLASFKERTQAKIVTLIVCARGKEFLLYRRGKEPFIGRVGFPYGKVHLGEKIVEAAHRELKEKAGVEAKLVRRGDAYITVYEHGELITHMLCHVFSGTYRSGEPQKDSPIGECFWGKVKDVTEREAIPGFSEVARLLETSKTPFFAELSFDIVSQ